MHPAEIAILLFFSVIIAGLFRVLQILYHYGLNTPVTMSTVINSSFPGIFNLVIDPLKVTYLTYFMIIVLLAFIGGYILVERNRRYLEEALQRCSGELITANARSLEELRSFDGSRSNTPEPTPRPSRKRGKSIRRRY